jgi:hypothetical protein
MADAATTAARVTGDAAWLVPAGMAISWFMGKNDRHEPVYDPSSGGCYDGLGEAGVNLNQGAESTLSALGAILSPLKPAAAP